MEPALVFGLRTPMRELPDEHDNGDPVPARAQQAPTRCRLTPPVPEYRHDSRVGTEPPQCLGSEVRPGPVGAVT